MIELLWIIAWVIGGIAALGAGLYLLMCLLALPSWIVEMDRADRKKRK